MTTERACRVCQVAKPRTGWHWPRDSKAADGFAGICKDCKKAQNKALRERNKLDPAKVEAERIRKAKWSAENPEWRAEYRSRPHVQEAARRSSKKNREANPEKHRESTRAWRRRKQEHVTAYEKQRAQDPERKAYRRGYQFKRRALVRIAKGDVVKPDIAAMLKKQHGKCCWCAELLGDDITVDHLQALAGPNPSNKPEDLALCHASCNSKRGSKSVDEYVRDLLFT